MDQEKNVIHPRVDTALRTLGLPYRLHEHRTYDRPIANPNAFAEALGVAVERITKTLFLSEQSDAGRSTLVCCSSSARLDMKRIAALLGFARLHMASEEALSRTLGYPRQGVSPIGAPSIFPVLLDASLLAFPSIWVGAGIAAVEIELAPSDLQKITGAQVF